MADFPTLGLKFDLAEMGAALGKLAQGKVAFNEIGDAAAATEAKTKGATRATKEGGDAAAAAGGKRKQASDTATRAEVAAARQIRETIAQLRVLNDVARALQLDQSIRARTTALAGAQEVAAAKATANAVRAVQQAEAARAARSAEQLAQVQNIAAFRARMERQRQAEVEDTARVETATAKRTAAEVLSQTRMVVEFKARMERQRRAEIAETARQEAAAARQVAAVRPAVGGGGIGRRGGGVGGGGGGGTPAGGDDERSIWAKTAAMLGLGDAYDLVSRKGSGMFATLGKLRVGLLNARFAAALFIGALTLGPVAAMADAMTALEARTAIYAKRGSDVPVILAEVAATAKRARAPLEGVSALYTRLAPLGDSLGRSQLQLLSVVETVSKAFAIGGASAQEATASAQQFAQALSSNRFGGDELRSVAENAPILLQAIAEGVNKLGDEGFKSLDASLNLNGATFIKWAQAGNANAEIVVAAMEKAKQRIDDLFRTMPVTVGQGVTLLGNSIALGVGEIDKAFAAMNGGKRLSTEIGEMIAGFAGFLESKEFIDGAAQALKIMLDVLQAVGAAIAFVTNNIGPLVAGLTALLIVTKLGPLFEALAFSIRVYGLATTVAVNGNLAMAASSVTLRAAWTALIAASPLIIIAGLTLAVMQLNDIFRKGAEAAANLKDAQQDTSNAIERARVISAAYGNDTKVLTNLMLEALGVDEQRTKGLTEAEKAALARAEADKAMAFASLESAKSDLLSGQASAARGVQFNNFIATVLRGMAAVERFLGGEDSVSQFEKDTLAAAEARVKSQGDALKGYDRMLGVIQAAQNSLGAANFRPTTPDVGSGVSTLGDAKDGDDAASKAVRGLQGAMKRIADFQAELATMQKEVAATEVGFFGPGGLDQLEVERAALEALANYGVQSLDAISNARLKAAAASEVQLATEVALKRLETDRVTGLIGQRKETENQTLALEQQGRYAADAASVMSDYYASASRGSAEYADALMYQAQRQTDAQESAALAEIVQSFGVQTMSELSGAVLEHAEALFKARQAQIRLTDAEKQAEVVRADTASREAQIAELNDYADAVDGGTRALLDFQRQAEINAALESTGGANIAGISEGVDKVAAAELRRSLAERTLAVVQQEDQVRIGANAREQDHYGLILKFMRANQEATIETATLAVAAATKELELRERIANMQRSIQDSIRGSFIDSGKLDFSSLSDGLGKAIRKSIYDNLLAKPINLVVNSAVDFVTKGAEDMIGKFMNAAGPWGQAAAAALILASMLLGKEQVSDNRTVKISAEDMQKLQGAGSVLGSNDAKSNSLIRAMELVADHTNDNLEYSNSMLSALRNIESGIGALSNVIARQISLSTGVFDTSGLGLGESTGGAGLLTKILAPLQMILPGLFGSKSTTSLLDQGIAFNPESVAGIMNSGINGSTYQDVEKNTTKKFLGVTYSNKTTRDTISGSLDAATATQVGLLIGSLKTGAAEAAKVLGVTGADALLDAMMINIGRISFKDMSGEEIQATLNAVFGKVADDMATTVLPVVATFQQVGEGAFETLTRLARNYQVIDVTLSSIGMTFNSVGVASIAARERLIDLAGGLDQFTAQASFFADNFLTDAEKLAPIQKAVTAELARLGLSGVKTRDQFKSLVLGLDLSTESGATMYSALMAIAPAFAAVTDSADEMTRRLADIADYTRGLLTGPLSPVSPENKVALLANDFQKTLALAQGGDAGALESITDRAGAYLEAAQQFYASSPEYAQIFDQVYAALDALSGAQQDPFVQAVLEQTGLLVSALDRNFEGLIAAWGGTAPVVVTNDNDPVTGSRNEPQAQVGDNAQLIEVLENGFTNLSDRIALGANAVVHSNEAGYGVLSEGLYDSSASDRAWKGGRVRQARHASEDF